MSNVTRVLFPGAECRQDESRNIIITQSRRALPAYNFPCANFRRPGYYGYSKKKKKKKFARKSAIVFGLRLTARSALNPATDTAADLPPNDMPERSDTPDNTYNNLILNVYHTFKSVDERHLRRSARFSPILSNHFRDLSILGFLLVNKNLLARKTNFDQRKVNMFIPLVYPLQFSNRTTEITTIIVRPKGHSAFVRLTGNSAKIYVFVLASVLPGPRWLYTFNFGTENYIYQKSD